MSVPDFCLRPVERDCLLQHAHTFRLKTEGDSERAFLFEDEEEKTYSLGAEERFSRFDEQLAYACRIDENKYCVLSQGLKLFPRLVT